MQSLRIRPCAGLVASIAIAMTAAMLTGTPASAHPSIDIAVANWKFVPAKITIPMGEVTVLRLTSTQGVHGIQSDALGIPQTVIANGKIVVVSFTPKKAGTYVIHCSVFCGPGHADMALTIVVGDGSAIDMSDAAHPKVDVTVENWKFTPAKITVPLGEPTTLRLTGTSGVHGIKSDDLGIPLTTIPNGKAVEVTFTPKKAGTYVLHCMIVCGPGHADMALTIVVAEASKGATP
jgi:cytochrome c oxidase subunit 2